MPSPKSGNKEEGSPSSIVVSDIQKLWDRPQNSTSSIPLKNIQHQRKYLDWISTPLEMATSVVW